LISLIGVLYVGWVGAETELSPEEITAFTHQLDGIEVSLKRGAPGNSEVREWLKQLPEIKHRAGDCATATEQNLDKIKSDLEALGPAVRGESTEVARERFLRDKESVAQEKLLANCRLLVLRSDEIQKTLTAHQQQQLAQKLLGRGPTLVDLLKENWQQPALWLNASKTFLVKHSGLDLLSGTDLATLAAVLLTALVTGSILRRQIARWLEGKKPEKNFSTRFTRALVSVYGHYLPHLLVTGGGALFFYYTIGEATPLPFVSVVAYGLPAYFLSVTWVQLFLAPFPPAEVFLPLTSDVARALGKRLKVLLLLIFVGYLLFTTLLAQSLPQPALLLVRGVFAAAFILNLVWAIWLFGRIPRLAGTVGLRSGFALVLISVLFAEWLGYRNLSVYVLRAVLGSLFALGLLLLVSQLLRELFDGLDTGRHGWHRWVRDRLALTPGARLPGLAWLRFVVTVLVWGAFAIALLRIWGLSEAGLQQLNALAGEGFTIGSLHIIPARILLALVALATLLAVSGWFRTRLERKWLLKTRMDRGAREAVVTMSGYAGVGIAVLIALAVAGMEFSNLAIIAGALSVGIGFGLQNIVNNFVSGLILLFERPIKTGDWIVVGNTEGYVRRISIRSTQIQTFDQADVIVPNSELISTQVTNWMLYDVRGRVRVPVGVAYGSDTQLVKEVLLQVARDHPLVVKDSDLLEPKVLFLEFADSALQFELRCFIQNIDRRFQVISDLNFAIDAAFREHGIEIPFPQRDIHIRDYPRGEVPPPGAASAEGGRGVQLKSKPDSGGAEV